MTTEIMQQAVYDEVRGLIEDGDWTDKFEDEGKNSLDGFLAKFGVDPRQASYHYLTIYEGTAGLVCACHDRYKNGHGVSDKQHRALLNIMMYEMGKLSSYPSSPTAAAPTPSSPAVGQSHCHTCQVNYDIKAESKQHRDYQCYTCKRDIHGYDALYKHRNEAHPKAGTAHTPQPPTAPATPAPLYQQPYHSQTTYKCFTCGQEFYNGAKLRQHEDNNHGKFHGRMPTNLDISSVPNGYYAIPDLIGTEDYIFLIVKRVRNDVRRQRDFVWSKYKTHSELVKAGTIEVKRLRGDTKELVAQQLPGSGELMVGDYEREMTFVVGMWEHCAQTFGRVIGRCGRCGKTLTDEDSRERGIGPECLKHGNWS